MSLTLSEHKPSFYIDSRLRETGTTSNFTYRLDIDATQNYDQCALVQMIMPKSFYNIGPRNNSFELYYSTSTGVNNIIIPVGNYNAYSLIRPIQNALNQASALLSNDYIFTISFNEITFKYDFKVTNSIWNGTVPIQPSFLFSSKLHQMLGFEHDTSNTFVNNNLSSQFQINVSYTKYINVKSSLCLNQSNLDGDNTDTLQRVPMNDVVDSSKIIYNMVNLEESSRRLISSKTNIFHFLFVDDHGDELEMNDQNTKLVVMLYKHNPYFELAINNLKIQELREMVTEKKAVKQEEKQQVQTEGE